MKTIYQRVSDIIMSIGVTESEINLKAIFTTDLGLDSLDMAELITLCEEEFGIDIPDPAVYHFIRINDVVQYIQTRIHDIEKPHPMNEQLMISKIAAFMGISKFRRIE
jgi:acyl carrier protein